VEADFRWQLAGDGGQLALFGEERRELASVEYLPVNARRIINRVPEASRMPFRFTINAYRGCRHGCTYCFARPTHEYLGLNMAEDFERRIVVKVNAVERLRAELADPAWRGDSIAMGTNTDPYQPAEGRYRLTRGILRVLGEAGNPMSLLTKSTMILRDLDVLGAASLRTDVQLALSIGTTDPDVWRATEPGTPPPDSRLEAVARLADAGLACSVLVAPILPGLSDGPEQLRAVARACAEAGARSVTPIVLHLRPGVREHYLEWLRGYDVALAAETALRYRGAYLATDDQRRIAATVKEEFRRCRHDVRQGRHSQAHQRA
jgi:DNA repair photolyase